MGLPQILIEFNGRAANVIKRSAMGIVALIIKDDTPSFASVEYKNASEIKEEDFTAENLDYIKKTLLGTPSKVIVEVLAADAPNYLEAQTRLSFKKFNYLAVPGISKEDATTMASYIKLKRSKDKKTFKVVLPTTVADDEGIINFTTEGIKVGDKTYSASEYTCRIAGILAGLPFTRSATYYDLPEVDSITESATPNEDIDKGQLILINDGGKIKIGRGVNSLTTTTETKTEDFKKIKVVEVMDMITDDIRDSFNNSYVGKVANTYDNQVLFFTFVNNYFKQLAADFVLDNAYPNIASVDVEAQRKAWELSGTNTEDWDDLKVKNMSFRSNVFAAGNIKIVDAMEDLDFQISI